MDNFQMKVCCSNCSKVMVMDLTQESDAASAKIAELITGNKPYHYTGEVDCDCGYINLIILTYSCLKKEAQGE